MLSRQADRRSVGRLCQRGDTRFPIYCAAGDGDRSVMEATIGERTAEPSVEKVNEQRNLDAF